MNLQQFEYLVAVDKHKSFSKAAEACFITQATLSTMVKKFEEEVGITIFDRKTLPILTTDCGKPYIEKARQMVKLAYEMKSMSTHILSDISGELHIGVIPTVASNLLHHLIPVLVSKYPNLILHIQEITTENIVNQLKAGTIDGGILSTPLSKPDAFEETMLYYEKLMVYGKLQTNNQAFLSPKDLMNENVWLLEQGNCISDQIMNVCQLSQKKMNNNIHFHPNSFESLLNIVDSLNGLTVIPELFVKELPKKRKVLITDFVKPYPVREISLVSHRPFVKKRLLDALANEIIALVKPLLETSKLKNKDLLIARM